MTAHARTRLFLIIAIGTLPELGDWLTLRFDWTPRGVSILLVKLVLAACINWRAFIDTSSQPPPEGTVTLTPPVVEPPNPPQP